MSELRPIGDFAQAFQHLDLGQYLGKDPPGVLVQDAMKATFHLIEGEPGDTVQLLLQADRKARESGETDINEIPRELAYMVIVLRSGIKPRNARLLLGSSAACDIIIPDESVSRKHAWIYPQGEDYILEDDHSTNGTWVEDDCIMPGQSRKLRSGDRVTLGGTEFIFLDPVSFYHFVRKFLQV